MLWFRTTAGEKLTADEDAQPTLAAFALCLLGILEQRSGDHGSALGTHAVVVQLEDLERGCVPDELEPGETPERAGSAVGLLRVEI